MHVLYLSKMKALAASHVLLFASRLQKEANSMEHKVALADDVHQHVCRIGGYWPPLSAVARLLEECGELAEVALNPS